MKPGHGAAVAQESHDDPENAAQDRHKVEQDHDGHADEDSQGRMGVLRDRAANEREDRGLPKGHEADDRDGKDDQGDRYADNRDEEKDEDHRERDDGEDAREERDSGPMNECLPALGDAARGK